MTAYQALQKWRAEKPDLFVKRVYEHAGLDTYAMLLAGLGLVGFAARRKRVG
jgi:hypothetical protein